MGIVKVITPSATLTTWREIKDASDEGCLCDILHSGDVIPVTLKNDIELRFVVAVDEAGKYYFVLEDCYPELHSMNDTNTNAGGWATTAMNAWLNRDVLRQFPDELVEVIADTEIVFSCPEERTLRQCNSKLFLFSMTQVFGNGSYSIYEPQDTQLDIFKHRKNRIKEYAASAYAWWLRSARSSTYFRCVDYYGNSYDYNAGASYGVVLGFCI